MTVLSMRKSITLPDKTVVEVAHAAEKWWTMHNRSGYVNPCNLAPDPDQPRRKMGEAKLKELYASVKERGVREPLTVTPRSHAPWVRVCAAHESCFFVIVSGHRRNTAALNAGLEAVPIRVVLYPNEDEHRTDAGLLNACRDDLTELEQGYDFVRLRSTGVSFDKISSSYGINVMQIYNRMNLTKLHPDLQKQLEVDSKGKRKLTITVGGILGSAKEPTLDELNKMSDRFIDIIDVKSVTGFDTFESLDADARRFAMQKLMVAVINKRHLNCDLAAEFIREQTLAFAAYIRKDAKHKTERYQPARRKDVLGTISHVVCSSVVLDWKPDEYRRIFELSSREEVENYLKDFDEAKLILENISKILRKIRDEKKPTSPEVIRLMNRRTVEAK